MDKKHIHIETWGCQMNTADSERLLALMQEQDYSLTADPSEADLILLNTCHIREKARHKVLSRLGVLKELKKTKKGLKIAVAGCVAQAEGKKLLVQAPTIDILLGPGKIESLPQLLAENAKTGKQAMAIGFRPEPGVAAPSNEDLGELSCQKADVPPPSITGKNEVSRFVNIQQGCDNFCTFCVVPFTRGREVSVPAEVVYAKAKALVKHGAKEIFLLGQNVNSYGLDRTEANTSANSEVQTPFVDLLRKVASLPDLARLRFTTSNPHDMSESLAQLFAQEPKLGKYYHLPVQSGSDRILATMKRKVTVSEYLQKIDWLRQAVPDMAISTDIIVGFPGESEEDFEGTLDLVRKVGFAFAFAFNYSPRKGTAAVRFAQQVPEAVKTERLGRLNQLLDQLTLEQHDAEVGQIRQVLFLYESKKEKGIFYGRTEHYRPVRVAAGRPLVGEILPVRITGGNKTAMTAVLC